MLIVSYRSTARASQERSDLASELRSTLIELISAAELILSYGLLQRYQEKISRLEKRLWRTDFRFGMTLGFAASLTSLGGILAVVTSASLSDLASTQVPDHMLALAVLTPFAVFDVASNLQSASIAFHRFALSKRKLAPLLTEPANEETGGVELGILDSIEAIDLELQRDEFVLPETSFELPVAGLSVLGGPSGSGKSSIAMALIGLLPYQGSLKVNGVEVSGIDQISLRSQVVLIEQNPHVFLGSVRDNLAISGQSDPILMQQALDMVGLLNEFSERGLLELELTESGANISGGQAQRLAIARAVMSGARYLILDEPTSGLDWENAMKLRDVILELNRSGVGFLIVTHDMEFASTLGEFQSLNLLAEEC
jgi:ABC-type transport system involved in cytochrome bd biosynthesis fused ATPase/permease subunit